jgi:hypothetical protein
MPPDHSVHVFINKQKYELPSATQTGTSLKSLAGIPLGDALFLQKPGEDLVITNESAVTLKNGDHLHSQPPADYGTLGTPLVDVLAEAGINPASATVHAAPEGWSFLVLSDYHLPHGYVPNNVRLLLKLPPTFPEAAPDMFWVHPAVRASNGSLPRATSSEHVLGEDWQRFSWHLASGAWRPGVSTLRDFLRCVAARFQRLD